GLPAPGAVVFVLVAIAPWVGACGGDPGGARLLDRVCGSTLPDGPACELRDDVSLTTGITEDSLGVLFGPSGGSFIVHLQAVTAAEARRPFGLDLPASAPGPAGSRVVANVVWGACMGGCPPAPRPFDAAISPSYTWRKVADVAHGPGPALVY